jgi:peptidoglycan/xylan/chitin deacetylase (PgdA/CDA1 family)
MKYFLTFDGAPHTPYTERILDVLSKEKNTCYILS